MVMAEGVRVGVRQTWVPTPLRASWATWADKSPEPQFAPL